MSYKNYEDAKAISLKDHIILVEKGFDSIKQLFVEVDKIDTECSILVSSYDTKINILNEKIKSLNHTKEKLLKRIK